jgi:hypothetical protein
LLILGQFLAEPSHHSVDLMQLNVIGAGDLLIPQPYSHTRAVAAGAEQTVQDGKKHNPFHRHLKTSSAEQIRDHLREVQFLPETPENKGGADAARGHLGCRALSMSTDHHHGFGEAGSRLQQALETSVLLQPIEASQRGDDALPASAVFPAIFHDLEIDVIAGHFLSEEHGGLPADL